MIPIIRWTLWQRRWYIFWWALGIAAYMAIVVIAYPSFRNQAAALNTTFDQLPATVKSLVSDTNNLFSPIGYLSSNAYYIMLPIVFSVLSIGLGSSLIAHDEQNHTLELILSRPVSRGSLLLGRGLAGLCIIGTIMLFTAVITAVFAAAININIAVSYIVFATISSALLAVLFGSVAFMFTAFGKSARLASIAIATFLLIASYLITSLGGTVHWLRWPAKVLPYHYYHPAEILGGQINWNAALGAMAIVICFGLISYLGFRRRDLY